MGDGRLKVVTPSLIVFLSEPFDLRRNLHAKIPTAGRTTAKQMIATMPMMLPAESGVFPCGGVFALQKRSSSAFVGRLQPLETHTCADVALAKDNVELDGGVDATPEGELRTEVEVSVELPEVLVVLEPETGSGGGLATVSWVVFQRTWSMTWITPSLTRKSERRMLAVTPFKVTV